jgi:hypothetical protein
VAVDDNTQSLHPNLARLAADYDDIIADFSRSSISVTEARARIRTLVARDDEGVQWSIDPDTADWYFKDRHGNLQKGTPPSYGHASPNPYSISRPGLQTAGDPDRNIVFAPVNEDLLHSPQSLVGATRRHIFHNDTNATPPRPRWVNVLIATVFVLIGIFVIVVALSLHSSKPTAPGPTGTTTSIPVGAAPG